AFSSPCALSSLEWVWGFAARRLPIGPRVLSPCYEGAQGKNTTPRGGPTRGDYRVGVYPRGVSPRRLPPRECRHDISSEPGELFLEFLGRHAFRPVDHHVLEPGLARLELANLLDHVRGRPAEPGLLRPAPATAGAPPGRPRHAPRAAPPGRVPAAAAGPAPLVAFVVVG